MVEDEDGAELDRIWENEVTGENVFGRGCEMEADNLQGLSGQYRNTLWPVPINLTRRYTGI